MSSTPNEEFTTFTQEDIVYDDGCGECETETQESLAFVNREESDFVIHESCLFKLKPRERDNFIAIKGVPSGKLTAAEKVDAMLAESLDEDEEIKAAIEAEEYQLKEPIQVDLG